MIIKAKDKNGNLIEFNPRGGRYRYKVNGEPKKGVTSLIGERSGKGALMWWSENCVYEALNYKFKVDGKAIDFSQQFIDDLKAKLKTLKKKQEPSVQICINWQRIISLKNSYNS